MSNEYDSGRLNLPFVGIASFGKREICLDWSSLCADVARKILLSKGSFVA